MKDDPAISTSLVLLAILKFRVNRDFAVIKKPLEFLHFAFLDKDEAVLVCYTDVR